MITCTMIFDYAKKGYLDERKPEIGNMKDQLNGLNKSNTAAKFLDSI